LKIINTLIEGLGKVQGRYCTEIKDSLFYFRKKFMDMISEINDSDGENGIARETNVEDALIHSVFVVKSQK
jgi:hypothetical protein